jgi:hypothetical protein
VILDNAKGMDDEVLMRLQACVDAHNQQYQRHLSMPLYFYFAIMASRSDEGVQDRLVDNLKRLPGSIGIDALDIYKSRKEANEARQDKRIAEPTLTGRNDETLTAQDLLSHKSDRLRYAGQILSVPTVPAKRTRIKNKTQTAA